jgi:hypothetical protein
MVLHCELLVLQLELLEQPERCSVQPVVQQGQVDQPVGLQVERLSF